MKKVQVKLDSGSYDIHIGQGLIEGLPGLLPGGLSRRCLLVTDSNVQRRYSARVMHLLEAAGMEVAKAVIDAGETSKTLEQAARLYDHAFEHRLDRASAVVALGGGVVGDLAGFVAATYMRGVPFIQLPTTLLAQVDSSVGGKVAVNHPKGKNIIGAFYQPRVVVIDPSMLGTLPPRELAAGMAEVVKYGMIWDEAFFTYLEQNIQAAMDRNPEVLEQIIYRCCSIKAEIVGEDEKEAGLRSILNFGHTIGHAVEALGRYRQHKHGEAVAIGMAAAAKIAVLQERLSARNQARLQQLLERVPLDTALPKQWHPRQALELIFQDKKVLSDRVNFILPTAVGRVETNKMSRSELERLLPLL